MELAVIDAPQSAPGTDAETNPIGRTILQSFTIANFAELSDLCYEAGKNKLFCTTPEAIIGKLLESLHRYGGPPVESDFLKWARRFVAKEAARYEITGRILAEHSNLIHDAIHKNMWTSAIDRAVEHDDVFWEVVYLIFHRAHSLDAQGKAKLSTRLYSLVEKHCYLYYNSKNAKRRKSVQRQFNEIGCECLSDDELAAMRASEVDDAAWNPGYSEVGLSMV